MVGGGWFLPAGHFEDGETISECAIREAREETGFHVIPRDISHVVYSWGRYSPLHFTVTVWSILLV
jgi:8-oxo-dGTP pyrophosphatase MutT (NUDIX family)